MKRILTTALILMMVIGMFSCASTGGLPPFGAEIGKQNNPIPGEPDIRIGYTDVKKYFGYVKPGAEPDAVIDGKKMFFLYVWVPLVAPEMGVRMLSPAPEGVEPAEEGDFISPMWGEAAADTENFFDTWIAVERAATIINPEDIGPNAKSTDWIRYDYNDDSSEMPANPSGSKYNSLLRIVSEPSDPLRALVRGLYRIAFTTYKRGEVQGSFYAEVGAPIEIPGVVIASSIEELVEKMKAMEE